MFTKLFAESGLSLDRLKALLAVGAAGSIVKAADGDAVKQSQYSRQIKELEDFFQIKLVERHGKGIRLTPNGKELARISRFFMLGLSNFQRGCLTEEQVFRIGASATYIEQFLMPVVSAAQATQVGARYIVETANDDEIERRLHDLTLDFGVTIRPALSRPLQSKELGKWRVRLWVPKSIFKIEKSAARKLENGELPLVLAERELRDCAQMLSNDYPVRLVCDNFLQALCAARHEQLAVILPDFLKTDANSFLRVRSPAIDSKPFKFHLAWNPRLLRLNPHAGKRRDILGDALAKQMRLPV